MHGGSCSVRLAGHGPQALRPKSTPRHWETLFLWHSFWCKVEKPKARRGGRGIKHFNSWQPTPVLLPGKSHGWRSVVGYSPWDRRESDMTERLHSNTPSTQGTWVWTNCEILKGREAWRGAVRGVAKSRTQLSYWTTTFQWICRKNPPVRSSGQVRWC